jgi:hypothetical protein
MCVYMRYLKLQRRRITRLVTVTALSLFVHAVSAAEYYTWIDDQGVTNYAERNPAGYEAEHVTRAHRFGSRMRQEPQAVAPEPAEEEASAAGEVGTDVDPQELIAAERQQYEQALAEERAFNCNVGKQNLARLSTFARVRIKDANGEERVMTENEMNDKKRESEELIRKNCSG